MQYYICGDFIRAATPKGDILGLALLSEQAWSFKFYTCSFETVTVKPGLLNDKIMNNSIQEQVRFKLQKSQVHQGSMSFLYF